MRSQEIADRLCGQHWKADQAKRLVRVIRITNGQALAFFLSVLALIGGTAWLM